MVLKRFVLIGISLIFIYIVLNLSVSVLAIEATIVDIPDNNSSGQVLIKKEAKSAFTRAKINDVIKENGVIATGPHSKAKLEILIKLDNNSSLLWISNNTYLQLSPNNKKIQIILASGKVKLSNSSSRNVSVKVGNYVAASEGTIYSVSVDDNPDNTDEAIANVIVAEGTVKFYDEVNPDDHTNYILPSDDYKYTLKYRQKSQTETLLPYKSLENDLETLKQTEDFDQKLVNRFRHRVNRLNRGVFQLEQLVSKEIQLNENEWQFARKDLFKNNWLQLQNNINYQRKGILRKLNLERRKNFKESIKQHLNPNKVLQRHRKELIKEKVNLMKSNPNHQRNLPDSSGSMQKRPRQSSINLSNPGNQRNKPSPIDLSKKRPPKTKSVQENTSTPINDPHPSSIEQNSNDKVQNSNTKVKQPFKRKRK